MREHTERPHNRESESRVQVTPAIAHVTAAAVETSFVRHEAHSMSDEQRDTLSQKTPDALHTALTAANKVSLESRHEFDKNDNRDFDVRNKEWNMDFYDSMQEFFQDPAVDTHIRGERRMTLGAIGLDVSDNNMNDQGLYAQVETFRQKYVSEKGSNINRFIEDISDGCTRADGSVDIARLENRLDAIKPMLAIFGTDKNADELVADFAVARAILSQKEDVKAKIATKIQSGIQRKPSATERTRLDALAHKLGVTVLETTPAPIETTTPSETEEKVSYGDIAAGETVKNEKGKPHQDRLLFDMDSRSFGVLDGVGGSDEADKAVQNAKDYLAEAVKYIPDGATLEEVSDFLMRISIGCNEMVLETTQGKGLTTLSLSHIYEGNDGKKQLIHVNIGDTRLYRLRDGKLEVLTLDDPRPFVDPNEQWARQRKLAALDTADDFRALSRPEKNAFHTRNEVGQALGIQYIEPSLTVHAVEEDDRYLITSDGIHDNLTDSAIESLLASGENASQAVSKLIEAAQARSRLSSDVRAKKDDMTAEVIDISADIPDKKPSAALDAAKASNTLFGQNLEYILASKQLIAAVEAKIGRRITPIEQQFITYVDNSDILQQVDVDVLYKNMMRARKSRLTIERRTKIEQEMQQLEQAGDVQSNIYIGYANELAAATFEVDSVDSMDAYLSINGFDEEGKTAWKDAFREHESKKPENTRALVQFFYEKGEDDVTQAFPSFVYEPIS